MRHTILTLAVGSALLTACGTLAPTYQRPAAPIAANWPAQGSSTATAALPAWQDFVSDAKLKQLISLALTNNRDLRIAALNVEKTQAQYQIARAPLLPHLNASATENAALTPADLSTTGQRMVSHEYNVGVGLASYEVDLFGRVRSLKDTALEQYLSTAEAQRSAQISLIAQVASGYIALAADQAHLQLAQQTLSNQQASFHLIQKRFELGAGSQLDVSQAQTEVDTARGDVARYTSQTAQDVNALTLLLGAPLPDALRPTATVESVAAVTALPAGLPSERLRNRPDVLSAEHQLKSANANIGAARAAFFPSITLTSSIGTASDALSGLFKAGSRTWSFIPQLNLPIFDGGVNRANLAVAKTSRDIALAQYDKTIQTAFREVSDSLVDHDALREEVAAQQSFVDASALSYKLSDARYQKGVDAYLVVLDSQRSLYTAQHNLITLKQAEANNLVTLYKALGGGADAAATPS